MALRLTKSQRAALREKFGGRCAYCGCDLIDGFHADHFEPVLRGYAPLTEENRSGVLHLARDVVENMMPSCRPCNLDKAAYTLEQWRGKLSRSFDSLARYSSTYRHALRFGMLDEKRAPIIFYFERYGAEDKAA